MAAHTKTTDPEAYILRQCGRRYQNKFTIAKSILVAEDRAANDSDSRVLADAIKNETAVLGFWVANKKCRITAIYANGTPFIDMDTGGTVVAKLTKAVIGGSDVDLNTNITIGDATAPTLDTSIAGVLNATLTNRDLIAGQHVILTVVVSNHTVTAYGIVTIVMEGYYTED